MNEQTTNLNVVTGSKLEESLAQVWDAMKEYVATNVDKSALMNIVKEFLDSANRRVIGETATEKAQAIDNSVAAMVVAFQKAGFDVSNLPTDQFAQCIYTMTLNSGVYIEDVNGVLWTASSWKKYKEEHSVEPANRQGIVLMHPNGRLLVGSKNYQCRFGTYGHVIPNLQVMDGGIAGTPKDGTYNARKILAATTPESLRRFGWAIDYFDGMTDADLVDKDVVFFPDEATLTSWANQMGLPTMLTIGQTMMYAVPHTEQGYWVLKFFSGTNAITFANREAKVPYTDNYGQVGCTAMNFCVEHREFEGDRKFWRCESLYEILLMYLNKAAINECRDALGELALPNAQVWSVLQNGSAYEYYLSLADGSYSDTFKHNQYWVVPCASDGEAVE